MFTGERCVGQPLLMPQQLVQFRAEARMARGNASQAGNFTNSEHIAKTWKLWRSRVSRHRRRQLC